MFAPYLKGRSLKDSCGVMGENRDWIDVKRMPWLQCESKTGELDQPLSHLIWRQSSPSMNGLKSYTEPHKFPKFRVTGWSVRVDHGKVRGTETQCLKGLQEVLAIHQEVLANTTFKAERSRRPQGFLLNYYWLVTHIRIPCGHWSNYWWLYSILGTNES